MTKFRIRWLKIHAYCVFMMFLRALYWKKILITSFIEYCADRQAYQKESVQNLFFWSNGVIWDWKKTTRKFSWLSVKVLYEIIINYLFRRAPCILNRRYISWVRIMNCKFRQTAGWYVLNFRKCALWRSSHRWCSI